jgi:hypothetical protein
MEDGVREEVSKEYEEFCCMLNEEGEKDSNEESLLVYMFTFSTAGTRAASDVNMLGSDVGISSKMQIGVTIKARKTTGVKNDDVE